MDSVIDDVIIYKLNNFLHIKDKTKLRLVNKHFYQLETKTINFHLGTLIANFLGLDHKCNKELKILRESKFEFLQEISNYLLNELDINIKKRDIYYKFPLGITLRIKSSTLDECKIKLQQPNIFRQYDKAPKYLKNNDKINKIYYYNYNLKHFPNVYAII